MSDDLLQESLFSKSSQSSAILDDDDSPRIREKLNKHQAKLQKYAHLLNKPRAEPQLTRVPEEVRSQDYEGSQETERLNINNPSIIEKGSPENQTTLVLGN